MNKNTIKYDYEQLEKYCALRVLEDLQNMIEYDMRENEMDPACVDHSYMYDTLELFLESDLYYINTELEILAYYHIITKAFNKYKIRNDYQVGIPWDLWTIAFEMIIEHEPLEDPVNDVKELINYYNNKYSNNKIAQYNNEQIIKSKTREDLIKYIANIVEQHNLKIDPHNLNKQILQILEINNPDKLAQFYLDYYEVINDLLFELNRKFDTPHDWQGLIEVLIEDVLIYEYDIYGDYGWGEYF